MFPWRRQKYSFLSKYLHSFARMPKNLFPVVRLRVQQHVVVTVPLGKERSFVKESILMHWHEQFDVRNIRRLRRRKHFWATFFGRGNCIAFSHFRWVVTQCAHLFVLSRPGVVLQSSSHRGAEEQAGHGETAAGARSRHREARPGELTVTHAFVSMPGGCLSCVLFIIWMLLRRSMRAVLWILPARSQRGCPVWGPSWKWVLMWIKVTDVVNLDICNLSEMAVFSALVSWFVFLVCFFILQMLMYSPQENLPCSTPWPALMDSQCSTQTALKFCWREVLNV